MTKSSTRLAAVAAVVAMFVGSHESRAQNRGGGPPPDETRQTPKAAAPADLTGYWVSVVTEDWRYRMVTPAKGDYQGVPMTAEAAKVADAWDPTSDEAAGQQCRSYGAAAIMRVPGRIRVAWQDDTTLQLDVDAGMQTRLFRFEPSRASPGEPTWQGESTAQWETPTGRGRGNNQAARKGSLKVVTRNLRSGYLRKNGVPYSESAVVTEYFDVAPLNNGSTLLIVTTIVEDPRYLRQPFIVSSQFKKQADASGWDPTPCSATW